jgi:hypothetical protein
MFRVCWTTFFELAACIYTMQLYYLVFISFVLFRIAYSVWMLKDLVGKSQGGNYSIRIMYDIGCLLTKHLQVKINNLYNTKLFS